MPAYISPFLFRSIKTGTLLVLLFSLAVTVSGSPIKHFGFEPLAVRLDSSVTPYFYIQTDGTVTEAILRHENGRSYALAYEGFGRFSIVLTHSQAVYGYSADDFNHNVLGKLDVYQGRVKAESRNVIINIADDRVPIVGTKYLSPQVQKSAHVVNISVPNLDPSEPDEARLINLFYAYFKDDYDFINLISVPSRPENPVHEPVQNTVLGIGKSLSDATAVYGSSGRLLGISYFPISTSFDMADGSTLHEIGHQWINYLASDQLPVLSGISAHWPLSSLARGLMGYQCCGEIQGLEFPYDFIPFGAGAFQLKAAPVSAKFTDMDLYLMGLLPAEKVKPHFVFQDQEQELCHGCVLTGGEAFTVDDVIGAYGPRQPAFGEAPNKFQVATIVHSQAPLSLLEMSFLDYFAARGSLTTEVGYSMGLVTGTTLPFYLATDRRGCLVMTLDSDGPCPVVH